MFFVTYLRRELRRRMRQAIVIAIGLALGIGLVITVMGASAGVRAAQAKVLRSLYGVGTDVTVTQKPTRPGGSGGRTTINVGPGGSQICTNGKCHLSAGTLDTLASPNAGPVRAATVAAVARLHGVAASAGALNLTDNQIVIPANASAGNLQPPTSFTVTGTDIFHPRLGPLSVARIGSGRAFTAADENRDVAVVDSSYAIAHGLKAGSTVTVAKVKFTVIGIATQPQGSSPPDVYIPLARAQALAIDPGTGKDLAGQVNTIYLTVASAAGIGAVQREIERLLPSATVTTSADLASQITGSLASTAKLANDLGRWLAALVLIAAFAVASLLTMAAVARRVPEFGTLKALGWRNIRIVSQLLGESLTTGIVGGLAGWQRPADPEPGAGGRRGHLGRGDRARYRGRPHVRLGDRRRDRAGRAARGGRGAARGDVWRLAGGSAAAGRGAGPGGVRRL